MMHLNKPRPDSPVPPDEADDAPLHDPGRPLVLRLLGLLGAAGFLLLGLSSLAPLLQPTPRERSPQPSPLSAPRNGQRGSSMPAPPDPPVDGRAEQPLGRIGNAWTSGRPPAVIQQP